MLVFFSMFFSFYLIYLIITLLLYDLAVRSTSKIIGSGIAAKPLKLVSYKFNIIINIINITLGSNISVKPKILKYSFVERCNTFKS